MQRIKTPGCLYKVLINSERSSVEETILEIENKLRLSHGKESVHTKINWNVYYKLSKPSVSVNYNIGQFFKEGGSSTSDAKKMG